MAGRKPRYLFSGLLVCADCGQHYVIRTNDYYGCASNSNRGPHICPNGRLVRRDRLEDTFLRLIFDEVFTPETVAYVSRKVNEALARRSDPPSVARKRQEAEVAKACAQQENIKAAILDGIRTPSTKEMLEAAERRVADLEGALPAPSVTSRVAVLPTVVETYLKDLKGSLGRDTERARSLLAKLIGQVTLRRDGNQLVAELRGNLPAPLELDDKLYNHGARGGILSLPPWPPVVRAVTGDLRPPGGKSICEQG
jgi:site-specific DNA recombinase